MGGIGNVGFLRLLAYVGVGWGGLGFRTVGYDGGSRGGFDSVRMSGLNLYGYVGARWDISGRRDFLLGYVGARSDQSRMFGFALFLIRWDMLGGVGGSWGGFGLFSFFFICRGGLMCVGDLGILVC